MKKIRTTIIVILAVFAFYTITGFFILPPILTSVLSKNLTQALHRNMTIEKIRTNPYTLEVELQGLSIKDQKDQSTFVSLKSLMVNVQWTSLFKRAPIVSELKLESPFIRIIRLPDGSYNFSDLMKGGKKKEKPQNFSVANIQIRGGRVIMDDKPTGKTHSITDINITIPFISNIPSYTNIFVQPSFQATINGTPFMLKGKTKPFSESLETTLALNLKDINLPYYLAYLPVKLGIKIDSGSLDLNALLSYKQFRIKQQPILNISGDLTCRDLNATEQDGKEILHLPKMAATLAPSRLLKKQVHVSQIAISSPELMVNRDRKGRVNLAEVMQKAKTKQPSPPTKAEPGKTPLTLTIDQISLSNGKISYTDISGSSPVTITAEDLSITARSLTTLKQGGGTVDLSCTLNQTGHLSLNTSFILEPSSADVQLTIEGFQIAWVQPYYIDQVPILLRRGTLASKGLLKIGTAQKQPPRIHFTGDVRVSDLAAVDRAHAEDLVSWKDLVINGIDLGMNPGRLAIQEIGLISPSSTITVNPDGGSNIGNIIAQKPSKTSSPSAKKGKNALESIMVRKITIKNGRITFTDRSIEPHFSSSLTGISGSISGLSSDEFKKANISLAAKLDNQAPLSITGAVNPLKKDLYIDLTASLNNLELSPATPYSGKYVGYAIDKGKLSLGLKYLIDKKLLQAQNDVLIDQLTFGNAVESKDATNLPVRLAVVLLRDNSGKIDLHLPVTGRTDDPDFHIGKIILSTIVNILEKAATSPFALLEALYPGASELSFVEFDPGRYILNEPDKQKLDKVTRILTDRTALNLELRGYMDTQNDKTGLINYLFEHKLKEQKLKDILRRGQQASSVDDIVIEQKEYSTYLEKAYKAFEFPGKPKNILGLAKTLPDEEMKKLMLENLKVTDDDLKGLAEARSQQVRDYLVETGKIDGSRIFLVKADTLPPEKIDNASNSRVSLTIK